MEISAKLVKELREITGAGMMDCKEALSKTSGDLELAKDWLRKKGVQTADKKAGRNTNQGLVGVMVRDQVAAIGKVNCETDFVARNENFQHFVRGYLAYTVEGKTMADEDVTNVIQTVGENIKLGEVKQLDKPSNGYFVTYIHNAVSSDLGSIGVIVSLVGGNEGIGKQIAMHIAAANPKAIIEEGLDPEWIERERKVFTEQALESGKPENIVEKMVDGKMKKALREVVLLDQQFVVDTEKTIAQVLDENGMEVVNFVRFEIGN